MDPKSTNVVKLSKTHFDGTKYLLPVLIGSFCANQFDVIGTFDADTAIMPDKLDKYSLPPKTFETLKRAYIKEQKIFIKKILTSPLVRKSPGPFLIERN
jgi:hypothetical protein